MSLAQAQTSGGVGASGSHGTSGSASGGISGGATVNQPAIDTNQAQQPRIGVNSGASGGGSIRQPGR